MEGWTETGEGTFDNEISKGRTKIEEIVRFAMVDHQTKEIITSNKLVKKVETITERGHMGTGSYYRSSTTKYYKKEK